MAKRIGFLFLFFLKLTEDIASGFFIARNTFYDNNVNLQFSFYNAPKRKLQLCIMIVACLSTCCGLFRNIVCVLTVMLLVL